MFPSSVDLPRPGPRRRPSTAPPERRHQVHRADPCRSPDLMRVRLHRASAAGSTAAAPSARRRLSGPAASPAVDHPPRSGLAHRRDWLTCSPITRSPGRMPVVPGIITIALPCIRISHYPLQPVASAPTCRRPARSRWRSSLVSPRIRRFPHRRRRSPILGCAPAPAADPTDDSHRRRAQCAGSARCVDVASVSTPRPPTPPPPPTSPATPAARRHGRPPPAV